MLRVFLLTDLLLTGVKSMPIWVSKAGWGKQQISCLASIITTILNRKTATLITLQILLCKTAFPFFKNGRFPEKIKRIFHWPAGIFMKTAGVEKCNGTRVTAEAVLFTEKAYTLHVLSLLAPMIFR